MNESDNGHRSGADRNPLAPVKAGISTARKVLVIVLAIIERELAD